MKTAASAIAILIAFAGSAHAVTCSTSTPVDAGVISDANTTIGGGGTYDAVGTANCPDQPGPQGDPGPQGPQGETGAQGPQGETGATGAQGPAGPQGDQGPQGVAGADGADGQDGAPGADGATGPAGPQGVAGADGAPGPKGDKGEDGKDGVDGQDGAKGDKGDKGEQGIAGKDFDPADLEKGLATMGALTVPHIDPNKSFGIAVSPSFYNSEAAIGFGVAGRIDETWQIGGSIATDFDGDNVAGKGVLTGQW